MSPNDVIGVLVTVHVDKAHLAAVMISGDGDASRGKWIPRVLLKSFHRTGKTTRGTDSNGQPVILDLAHITLPERKAQQEGLI
jgi:hypothetical protein